MTVETEYQSEVLEIVGDTDQPQLDAAWNITFVTFIMANYTVTAIKELFPNLYRLYGLADREE